MRVRFSRGRRPFSSSFSSFVLEQQILECEDESEEEDEDEMHYVWPRKSGKPCFPC
jgi:hypothetical protein